MKRKTTLSTAAAIVITALSLSGAALAQGGGSAGDGGGAAGSAHGPSVDSSGAMAPNSTGSTDGMSSTDTMKHKKMRHHKPSAITKDPNSTHMLGAHQGGAAATAGKDALSGGEGGAGGSGGGGGGN